MGSVLPVSTQGDPNGSFKVREIFKESFYQFYTPSEFPWLNRDLKPGPQGPSPSPYPLHNTGYLTLTVHSFKNQYPLLHQQLFLTSSLNSCTESLRKYVFLVSLIKWILEYVSEANETTLEF